jgi:hypothetical protein
MVEVRQIAVAGAHAGTAVEQEDDLLVALVGVLARDQAADARAGFPVDLPRRVVLAVVAQLLELHSLTAPPPLQDADLRQAVVGRQQRVVGDAREIREDPHLVTDSELSCICHRRSGDERRSVTPSKHLPAALADRNAVARRSQRPRRS